MPGDLLRVPRFVKTRVVEPDRKRLDAIRRFELLHQRHDGRRIDTARQQRAHRHVGHQAFLHCLAEQLQDPAASVGQWFGGAAGLHAGAIEGQIPVSPDAQPRLVRFRQPVLESAAGFQTADVLVDALFAQHIVVQQVRDERFLGQLQAGGDVRMGPQSFQFRSKREGHASAPASDGPRGVEQRLFAQPVPRPNSRRRRRSYSTKLNIPSRNSGQRTPNAA